MKEQIEKLIEFRDDKQKFVEHLRESDLSYNDEVLVGTHTVDIRRIDNIITELQEQEDQSKAHQLKREDVVKELWNAHNADEIRKILDRYGQGQQTDDSQNNEGLYYITSGGYNGNDLVMWMPAGGGYTSKLEKAGKYTKEEAMRICSNKDRDDIAWPVEYFNAICSKGVDSQFVDYGKALIIHDKED